MSRCKPTPIPGSGIGVGQKFCWLFQPHFADSDYLVGDLLCSGEILKGLINIRKP